jgi:hypothetical protein
MKIIPKEIRENNDCGAYVLLLFQLLIGIVGLGFAVISILGEPYGVWQKSVIGVIFLAIYFHVKGVVRSTLALIKSDKMVGFGLIVRREVANISFIVAFIGCVALIIFFIDKLK